MSNTYNVGVNLWFNNNWINSVTGLLLISVNPYAPPKRILNSSVIARADKVKTSSAFYTQRLITARASIARASRDLMETSIGDLNNMLQGIEKDLVVMQGGASRKYTATLDGVDVKDGRGGYASLEIRFLCSDLFGYDPDPTVLLNVTGQTGGSRSDGMTFGGTADWQLPTITATYTALTGGTSKNVIIGNASTGQQITVNRTWLANDVLEIDVQNRTVRVNGTEVAYSGAFPEFAVGAGTLSYSDNLTTRTFNYNVKYYKRYV